MATRTDKNGIEWNVDAQGNPISPVAPRGGGLGPDPYKVNDEARKAQAAVLAAQAAARANNNAANANANTQKLTGLAKLRFAAELKAKGLMVGPDGQIVKDPEGVTAAKPALTGAQYSDALAQYNGALYLRDSVEKLKTLNDNGPGSTRGIYGVQDFFPTKANSNFNKEADRLRAWAKQGTGTTGGENNSLAEMKLNLGAYIPNSFEYDSTNQGTFESLQALAEKSYNEAIQRLGGIPDAGGRITPIDPQVGAPPLFVPKPTDKRDDSPAGALPDQGGGMGGGPKMPSLVGGVPAGSDIQFNFAKPEGGFDRNAWLQSNFGVTPNQEAAITAFLKANRGNHNFSYNDVAAFYKGVGAPAPKNEPNVINSIRAGNVNVTGYDSTQAEKAYQDALAQRVKERDTTAGAFDTVGRTGANALFGAGDRVSAGFDTLTGGGSYSDNLARQRFESDAAREANPLAALGGDVGGAILTTTGMGRFANNVATRFMPSLARTGAPGSSLARNVANDTAYGAGYGLTEQGDPFTGAVMAGGGSAGGQYFGKTIKNGLEGVTDPAVRYLTDRGIPLTMGQTFGNRGLFGKAMNKMESVPFLGDMMGARRLDGMKAFEREALKDVVAPVGGNVTMGGREGLMQAQDAVQQGYRDALSGVNVSPDQQFVQEAGAAMQAGGAVPKFGEDFTYAMNQELGPLFGVNGNLTGPQLQSALQSVGKVRSGFAKNPDAMATYAANATGQMDDAISNLVGRQAPDVMPAYNNAKDAFSNLVPFEKARIGAINQEAISPAQLQRAVTSNTSNFGGRGAAARGANLTDLMRFGQEVLPSTVPDSGSAGRMAGILPFVLPTALGGSAAYSGIEDNPGTAGLLATLALMSTKGGQKAVQNLVVKRPDSVRRIGGMFGRRQAQEALGSAGGAAALSYYGN